MKNIYFAIALISPFLLTGCWTKPTELPANTETIFSLGESYVIWGETSTQKDVYGVVIWDNLKNVFSTIGGFVTQLDCQPGQTMSADDIVAEITPNQNDPAIKNLYIQQISLKQQLQNIEDTYTMTEQNFELQRQSVEAQTENSENIYNQDSADLTKLEHSIQNFKNQQANTIQDTFKKIRASGGDTRYSNLYDDLSDNRDDVQDLSDDDFSEYLADMADLSERAAQEASGDALYSMFIGLSNGFRASKSSFDSLVDSYTSAQNAYDNQHDTLGTNLDLVDSQLQTIENNKEIQLNALENQRRSTQQILDSLSNSLAPEYVYAEVDGVVKAKLIWSDNRVNPNTILCQIIPNDSSNKKIQIYSANKIDIGQVVKLFNGDTLVGVDRIDYELPYKDPLTQNYIYEITDMKFSVNEWDKLNVQFFKKLKSSQWFWFFMNCLSWIYILKKQTILYSESHKELALFGYFPGNEGKYAREV
jgi:hypothetical protein